MRNYGESYRHTIFNFIYSKISNLRRIWRLINNLNNSLLWSLASSISSAAQMLIPDSSPNWKYLKRQTDLVTGINMRGNEILTILKILKPLKRSCDWNQFEAMKYWQYWKYWKYWNRQTDLVGGINMRGNERRVQSRARQSHLYVDNLTCRKLPFVTRDGSHTPNQRIDPNIVQILCVQGDMTILWVRGVDGEFSAL